MNTIELSLNRFYNFSPLKSGVVHQHKKMAYKYSPNSLAIMMDLEHLKKEKTLEQIVLAKAFLYWQKKYWGFAMPYLKETQNVFQFYGREDFDKKEFIFGLIDLLNDLDDLNLCYYDLHFGNVKVMNGKSILFDADSIVKNAGEIYLSDQRKNLLLMILSIYFECQKVLHLYEVQCFDVMELFTSEVQNYFMRGLAGSVLLDDSFRQIVEELDELDKKGSLENFKKEYKFDLVNSMRKF